MKKFMTLLLVAILTCTLFSTALADFEIEEKTITYTYTWREVVAHDDYKGGNLPEEILVLSNLNCFQQLVWLIGEETADEIDLGLTVYTDGDLAIRFTYDGETRGACYILGEDYFVWMHSSADNKLHVLLTDELVDRVLERVKEKTNH